jgi:hypothetical protein
VEALEVIASTHAHGNTEDQVVLATYKEIIDSMAEEQHHGRNLTPIALFKSKESLRRLMLCCSVAVITMVSGVYQQALYCLCMLTDQIGNNIITFYLGIMLTNAGITDTETQLQIVSRRLLDYLSHEHN